MFDSGSVSKFKIAIDEKIVRIREINATVANVPLALFLKMKLIIILVERNARSIRNILMILIKRPQRRKSTTGMLETKSIHPHFKKRNLLGARYNLKKKS